MGPPGPAGQITQLVIGFNSDDNWNAITRTTIVYAENAGVYSIYPSAENLVIMGACFPPNTEVTITICESNFVWFTETTNNCGAFYRIITLGSLSAGAEDYLIENYWLEGNYKPVSVRVWINATVAGDVVTAGELMGNWPLYVVGTPL